MTSGSSMQAMIRTAPPQAGQISISMPNTYLKRCVRVIATRGIRTSAFGECHSADSWSSCARSWPATAIVRHSEPTFLATSAFWVCKWRGPAFAVVGFGNLTDGSRLEAADGETESPIVHRCGPIRLLEHRGGSDLGKRHACPGSRSGRDPAQGLVSR
jgi:hypothetical protein